MSSSDNTATTWRDLADQLTPEQIAELEYCEREQIPPGNFDAAQRVWGQLNCARRMAEVNIARAMYADIPVPADAIGKVADWIDYDDGLYQRAFTSWKRDEGAHVSVEVFGLQLSDGRLERSVVDKAIECCMTAVQARQRAAALLDAADALDRLSGL